MSETARPASLPRRLGPSLLLGACGAWAITSHRYVPGLPLGVGVIGGMLGATLVLTVLLHRWLLPGVVRQLAGLSGRARLAWVLGCGLLALVLLRAAVLHAPRPHLTAELTLTATGQHVPGARGSEVWLEETIQSDGSHVSASEWKPEGGWERRPGGVWMSYQDQPARLRWTGEGHGADHPEAGVPRLLGRRFATNGTVSRARWTSQRVQHLADS